MNIFSICCFGFVIVAILGLVIYALIKKVQSLKLENTRLNTALSSAKENVSQLVDYIENVQKIKIAEKSTADKIKEAKTDEEIYSIVATIIKSNNSKLQDD